MPSMGEMFARVRKIKINISKMNCFKIIKKNNDDIF